MGRCCKKGDVCFNGSTISSGHAEIPILSYFKVDHWIVHMSDPLLSYQKIAEEFGYSSSSSVSSYINCGSVIGFNGDPRYAVGFLVVVQRPALSFETDIICFYICSF